MKNMPLSRLAVVLAMTTLFGCAPAAEPDPDGGVGRDPAVLLAEEDPRTPDETAGESAPPEPLPVPGASDETDPIAPDAPAIAWSVENGTYTYTFPARDTSGMADLSAMETFSREPFPDQPDDWFFGKTERDAQTGEVRHIWDRDAKTLEALARYGAIYRGDEEQKVCYLTFDCGYEAGTMPGILDTLREKQVPATFFVNGHYVRSAADQIERMLAEGHILANHCVNHDDLTEVSVETFVAELEGLEDLYYDAFPEAPPMLYFRPPSGSCNEWVLRLADKMGYTTVLWSWAYYDYDTNNQPAPEEALAKVRESLHNGAVYLFHPESTANAAMLGDMIDFIRGEGYEILPLCAIRPDA